MAELQRLDGPDAVRIAMDAFVAGRALERIADHARSSAPASATSSPATPPTSPPRSGGRRR